MQIALVQREDLLARVLESAAVGDDVIANDGSVDERHEQVLALDERYLREAAARET